MCAGGIINSRIETVRYGARDEKAGCCSSVLNLFEERFNHHPRIYLGPLEPSVRRSSRTFSWTCGRMGKTEWGKIGFPPRI